MTGWCSCCIGAIVGGFVSGWFNGRLKVETNKGPRISDTHALGHGLRRRRDHGLSGRAWRAAAPPGRRSPAARCSLPGAWAFMFAIFAGGYALAYFVRKTVDIGRVAMPFHCRLTSLTCLAASMST